MHVKRVESQNLNDRPKFSSNFCLIQSKTLLTNDFKLTVPDL